MKNAQDAQQAQQHIYSDCERVSDSRTDIITAHEVAVRLGNHTIWRGGTFNIDFGEFVTIVGPNGAGKSTLLRCPEDLLEDAEVKVVKKLK